MHEHINIYEYQHTQVHKHTHLYMCGPTHCKSNVIDMCRCMCVGKYVSVCVQTLVISKPTCIYAM